MMLLEYVDSNGRRGVFASGIDYKSWEKLDVDGGKILKSILQILAEIRCGSHCTDKIKFGRPRNESAEYIKLLKPLDE